ncbi:MAG: hypothetical protein Tsb002_34900 [Wenzhouxiangellaceae bacterium]
MEKVTAWLLDLGAIRIAVAHHAVVEVLSEAQTWPLAVGPRWCRELLAWRGRFLPLARLGQSLDHTLVIIIAVTVEQGQRPEYVALRLNQVPESIEVMADADCELPAQYPLPADALLACFQHQNHLVTVPDLGLLFKLTSQ